MGGGEGERVAREGWGVGEVGVLRWLSAPRCAVGLR